MAFLTDATRRLLALSCAAALVPAAAPAREAVAQIARGAPEEEVKAAYLLNFTRYVDWPRGAFGAADAPVNLCVLGTDRFGEVVYRLVEGRRSRGRTVRVIQPDTPRQAADCHVAFVAGPARAAREWMEELRGAPTLTVGDGQDFIRRGGMVAFVIVDQTVRFEIDAGAARRAGLGISSRVLALATRLRGEPPERQR